MPEYSPAVGLAGTCNVPPTVKEVDPLALTAQEETHGDVKLSTVNVPEPPALESVIGDEGNVTLKLIAAAKATVKLPADTPLNLLATKNPGHIPGFLCIPGIHKTVYALPDKFKKPTFLVGFQICPVQGLNL